MVLCVVVIAALWWRFSEAPTVFETIAKEATFPIYEPVWLPAGYHVDESSVSLTAQALLFTASNYQAEKIIVTQTPVPKSYDFESFYEAQMSGVQDAQSIYGRGKVGLLDEVVTGSLVTDSTWLLLKSHSSFSADDMKKIISSMRPVQ